MVANRAAIDVLRIAAKYRGAITAHDWWTYQIVTGVGGIVIYDDRPAVYYRQHSGNMIGSNRGAMARFRRVAALADGQLARWSDQNIAALNAASAFLTPGNRRVVQEFAELRKRPLRERLNRFTTLGLHRQTRASQAALWMAAACGRA
jgi:hypothetical protein